MTNTNSPIILTPKQQVFEAITAAHADLNVRNERMVDIFLGNREVTVNFTEAGDVRWVRVSMGGATIGTFGLSSKADLKLGVVLDLLAD